MTHVFLQNPDSFVESMNTQQVRALAALFAENPRVAVEERLSQTANAEEQDRYVAEYLEHDRVPILTAHLPTLRAVLVRWKKPGCLYFLVDAEKVQLVRTEADGTHRVIGSASSDDEFAELRRDAVNMVDVLASAAETPVPEGATGAVAAVETGPSGGGARGAGGLKGNAEAKRKVKGAGSPGAGSPKPSSVFPK